MKAAHKISQGHQAMAQNIVPGEAENGRFKRIGASDQGLGLVDPSQGSVKPRRGQLTGSLSGIEASPSGLARKDIDRMAEKFARDHDIDPHTSLEKVIVSHLGGRVRYTHVPLASTRIDIRAENDWTVTLRDSVGPIGERVYLAQAIGHYLLHFNRKEPVSIAYDHLSEIGKVLLKESLWFAMGLLLPRSRFLEATGEEENNWRLSWQFQVSPDWVEKRRSTLTPPKREESPPSASSEALQ